MSDFRNLIVVLLVFISMNANAQRKIKQMDPQKEATENESKKLASNNWRERMVYGGNVGLSISSIFTQIFVQPIVGYKITKDFMAGGGFTYIYWKQSYAYYNSSMVLSTTSIDDNVFGLNFFARHTLIDQIFVHGEYQPMNFTSYNRMYESKRVWGNALYLGGGINQSMGTRGGAYVLILYDVLWEDVPLDPKSFAKSFYPTPWNFRVGFMF